MTPPHSGCAASPLQGATLVARQSRFHGVPALDNFILESHSIGALE